MARIPLSDILVKAMDNAHEGITIADLTLPDNPLIYVNKGFLKMTGYEAADCIGRNCRYLQGPDTDRETVREIRDAIRAGASIQVELLNYTRQGQPFWNYFSLTPITSESGEVTHYIGIQEDISVKKELLRRKEMLKKQRLMAEAMIEGQETERQAIGKELHDNVTQLIATLRLYLNMARNEEDNRQAMIEYATGLTDNLLAEVRRVSHRLAGPAFEVVAFREAVGKLVTELEPVVPFDIKLTLPEELNKLIPDRLKLIFYRILQEQMHNILKYASASVVEVCFAHSDQSLSLDISDNGVGFDPQVSPNGIGFRNIGNRVEMEAGVFHIDSAPGHGCRIHVSIPID